MSSCLVPCSFYEGVCLGGSLRPGGGSLYRGSLSGRPPDIDPLYGEGRMVPILLECFLVLSVFSGCTLFDLPCKAIQFCLKVKVRLILEFNLVGDYIPLN